MQNQPSTPTPGFNINLNINVSVDPSLNQPSHSQTGFNPFSHPVPSWVPAAAWNDWLQMRQTAPMKEVRTPAALNRAIELLQTLRAEGYDLEKTILKSIRCQWTDFYRKDECRASGPAVLPS